MRILATFVLISASCLGQVNFGTDTKFAVGPSFNPSSPDRWAVTALMATPVPEVEKTYAFVVGDGIPVVKEEEGKRMVILQGNVAAGVAIEAGQIWKAKIYVPGAAGVSWTGENLGWLWTTGVLARIPLKYGYASPGLRVHKSSLGDYRAIVSLLWGF